MNIYIVLITVHVLLCISYLLIIKLGIARLSGVVLPIMLLVPLFGPVSVLLIEWLFLNKKDGTYKSDIHKQVLGDSVYNKILLETDEKPEKVIPLEEAILINDVTTRRALMMDVLHRDPVQYLDLLMLARLNSDVEVTHYATTTIMEIQREFELAIQKASVDLKNNPSDISLLDKYIDVLGKYIDSNLLDGNLLVKQRLNYSAALNQRIAISPDKQTYFRMFDNDIRLRDFSHADEMALEMRERWPSDENVWFAVLRLYHESKNSAGKRRLLKEINDAPIEWTIAGKEKMLFWYGRQAI